MNLETSALANFIKTQKLTLMSRAGKEEKLARKSKRRKERRDPDTEQQHLLNCNDCPQLSFSYCVFLRQRSAIPILAEIARIHVEIMSFSCVMGDE